MPPDTSASPCHCRGITMGRRLQLRLDIERYRKVSACAQQRGTAVAAVIGRPLTAVSVVPTTGAQPRAVAFWTRSRCRSRMYGGCWRSSTLCGVAGRDRARPDGAGVRDRPRGALPIAARRGSRTLHPRRGLTEAARQLMESVDWACCCRAARDRGAASVRDPPPERTFAAPRSPWHRLRPGRCVAAPAWLRSVRRPAEIGVVGDRQTVLAQPRSPDVVGVRRGDQDAGQQQQRRHHPVQVRRAR